MSDELKLSLPEYDEEEFGKKYAELSQCKIEIPENITTLGFTGINTVFTKVQAMLDRVNELLAEATQKEALAKAMYEATKSAVEAKYAALLSSKSQGEYQSIKILEAQVNDALAVDKKLMQRAKLTLGLFVAYRKTVQGKYKNLESAKENLSMIANNYKRQMPPPVWANPSH